VTLRIFKALLINFSIGYPLSCIASVIVFYGKLKDILALIIAGDFFIYGLLLLTSLTAFLMLIKEVRETLFLSVLSAFLLPTLSSIVLLQIAGDSDDFLFYLVCIVVFMIIHSILFVRIMKNRLV